MAPNKPSKSPTPPKPPTTPKLPVDPRSPMDILTEMLDDLVDLLAGNAPVITLLNYCLFEYGLIAKAVHIEAQNSFYSPFERAKKIFNAVLATLEWHPNHNRVLESLITALHRVGMTMIATKLMECFSKCMHH